MINRTVPKELTDALIDVKASAATVVALYEVGNNIDAYILQLKEKLEKCDEQFNDL